VEALTGWTIPAEFPVYLSPPERASYALEEPQVSGLAWAYGGVCDGVVPGFLDGSLTFDSNVQGTWHLLCDTNRDGVFDPTHDGDVHRLGEAVVGTNVVTFDGRDNAGGPLPQGVWSCVLRLTVGEFHFVAQDVETSYPGMRMYRVNAGMQRTSLPMYWNDAEVQDRAKAMPDGEFGLQSPGPEGLRSGPHGSAPEPNLDARSWGAFDRFGKGNESNIDTFTWLAESTSSPFAVAVLQHDRSDQDADRLSHVEEACLVGTDPNRFDTDGDGLGDGDEVLDVTSDPLDPDTDQDGAPDGAEVWTVAMPEDTDADGLNDALDTDDDGDGVPTLLEDVDGDGSPYNDHSDGDGVSDHLDFDDDGDGRSTPEEDIDGDGSALNDDTDADGTPDFRDVDDDGDGVLSLDELGADSDGDGTPDPLDTDDDGDGILTLTEGDVDTDGDGSPDRLDLDSDADGAPDASEGEVDTDGDGAPDYVDTDDDGDGIPSLEEGEVDTDQDGTPDRLDEDDDGDGISTRTEREDASGPGDDVDGDGVPNWHDQDSDDDGLSDSEEGRSDADGDGIPDYLDPREAIVWLEGCGGCSGTGGAGTGLSAWFAAMLALGCRRRRRWYTLVRPAGPT
jgi:hypothetical protein